MSLEDLLLKISVSSVKKCHLKDPINEKYRSALWKLTILCIIIIIIIIFQLIFQCTTASFPFLTNYFLALYCSSQWLEFGLPLFYSLFSALTPFPLTLPPSLFLWSFTISPSRSLRFSLSLSPTGSGNTVDISPTWLPDTASAPFQFHPSFLPFSLFPPPTLSSLAGVKEKQKLAPDHVEVIGIKLHWKWKCQ